MQQAQHRKRSPYSIASFLLLLIYTLVVCSTCNATPKYFYIVNKQAGDGRCKAIWEETTDLYSEVTESLPTDGHSSRDWSAHKPGDANTYFTDKQGANTCIEAIFSDFTDHKELLGSEDPVTFICFGGDGTFSQTSEALYNKLLQHNKSLESGLKICPTYHIGIMPCGTDNSMCRGLNIGSISDRSLFNRRERKKEIKCALITALTGKGVRTSMFQLTPVTRGGKFDSSSSIPIRYASVRFDSGQKQTTTIQINEESRQGYVQDPSKKITVIAGTTATFFGGDYKIHPNQGVYENIEGVSTIGYKCFPDSEYEPLLPITIISDMSLCERLRRTGAIKDGRHIGQSYSRQTILYDYNSGTEPTNQMARKSMTIYIDRDCNGLQIDGETSGMRNCKIEHLDKANRIRAAGLIQ